MTISWIQASILGIFASLSSMPGMAGSTIGNYTLGRPLVGGLVSGLILGDLKTGIAAGVAMQLVYIALVTPGGTVSADLRAVSYIGIPLAMVAIHAQGLSATSGNAADLAKSMGTLVGTVGTVLFYGTATMNLVWQHMGWRAVEKGDFKKLYAVDWGYPWISHLFFSFIPTLLMTHFGSSAVQALKTALPMDGIPMKTLFTVGALLPCVGIAILLKQIVDGPFDFIPFFVGFTLAASLKLNLVSVTVISLIFALIFYKLDMAISTNRQAAAPASGGTLDDDEEEEDI
ncbi:PTS mannose/fructose/sorbose/N-acetylgalactosamine transporter subunit IIC [Leuconostoc miyukkimchii]|uniref:PTS mannose/fructose/sorbose/N-acetylgalactosamine transporter subunit IIC n=1 Tax=Leuconostoc miyukkimchii TaxID=910540 RepID=UPI001C7D8A08|nr:PTS sugar transporter subunit IIC [Leuconostoc miyukkimchii]